MECPLLKEITLVDCPKMFAFASTFLRGQDIETVEEISVGLVLPTFSVIRFCLRSQGNCDCLQLKKLTKYGMTNFLTYLRCSKFNILELEGL